MQSFNNDKKSMHFEETILSGSSSTKLLRLLVLTFVICGNVSKTTTQSSIVRWNCEWRFSTTFSAHMHNFALRVWASVQKCWKLCALMYVRCHLTEFIRAVLLASHSGSWRHYVIVSHQTMNSWASKKACDWKCLMMSLVLIGWCVAMTTTEDWCIVLVLKPFVLICKSFTETLWVALSIVLHRKLL